MTTLDPQRLILTVFDLRTERPKVVRETILTNVSKDDALEALYTVRSGLPAWCGASLTDPRGYNVRPQWRAKAIYQDLLEIRSRFQMWFIDNRDRHEFPNDDDQNAAEAILEAIERLEDKLNVPL